MLLRAAILAAAIARVLLSESPSPIPPLQQALTLFNSGKYQECFKVLSPYVRLNPANAAAHKLLGMDEFMLGKAGDALAEVRLATELAPNDADAFYYLGRLYFSADNSPAALHAFERAVQLDPSSVRIHNQLGQTLEALGREQEAERAYLKAIELSRDAPKKSEWPFYNLGLLCFHNGRTEEATRYFRQALDCNPQFPEAKVKLAVILSKQGSSREAARLLQEALQSDAANAEGHYRLGLLLLKNGNSEEARREFALFEKYRKR